MASRYSSPNPTPTRALALAATKSKNPTFSTMVKNFIGKRSNLNPKPCNLFSQDTKKKGSWKLFQRGSGDRSAGKALPEVKANTRTLAMVLRSEGELLGKNRECEDEIKELRLLVEEKNRQVEKLKDLCLKQRQEIKALKDAILFPDVMNSQLQDLLEKQGSELKQARQIIPSLQNQVSSLSGQLQCIVDDLAEVKADKYAARTCFDESIYSPKTPKFEETAQNSLEYSSGCPISYGSPDDMFLRDLNPCLTPCFSKTKSKVYGELPDYESRNKGKSWWNLTKVSPDNFSNYHGGILSRSPETCQQTSPGFSTARKIYRSDENKWGIGKAKRYLEV